MPDAMRPRIMDPSRDVVMGHEFSAEVLELGDNVGNVRGGRRRRVAAGRVRRRRHPRRSATPTTTRAATPSRWCCRTCSCMKVPNGLDPRHAALTEPMAVGLHAVNKSSIQAGQRRRRARLRPGRARRHRRAPRCRRRADRRRRLLAHAPRRSRSRWAPTRSVDPREEPAVDAWRRVGRHASRCTSSKRSACPA